MPSSRVAPLSDDKGHRDPRALRPSSSPVLPLTEERRRIVVREWSSYVKSDVLTNHALGIYPQDIGSTKTALRQPTTFTYRSPFLPGCTASCHCGDAWPTRHLLPSRTAPVPQGTHPCHCEDAWPTHYRRDMLQPSGTQAPAKPPRGVIGGHSSHAMETWLPPSWALNGPTAPWLSPPAGVEPSGVRRDPSPGKAAVRASVARWPTNRVATRLASPRLDEVDNPPSAAASSAHDGLPYGMHSKSSPGLFSWWLVSVKWTHSQIPPLGESATSWDALYRGWRVIAWWRSGRLPTRASSLVPPANLA